MVDILTQKNALEQLAKLRADKFIGELQFRCLKDLLKSDERAFFIEQVDRLYSTVEVMPKILEQDGKGDNAIAYLHYFTEMLLSAIILKWAIFQSRKLSGLELKSIFILSLKH